VKFAPYYPKTKAKQGARRTPESNVASLSP
jgi:hypothetical protein